MSGKTVSVSRNTGVAELTLSRPDVLNSFDAALRDEFSAALADVIEDSAVRAVLLTGTGRGFCAGQDLAELQAADAAGKPLPFDRLVEQYNEIIRRIAFAPKPFVCAVNGVAAGAGANLALACDFVIASGKASFVQAFVNVGLIPDSGGTFFLPRLAGLAKARELTMLGEKLSADEALALGLIYRVFPEGEFLGEARKLAERLAAMPTKSLGLIKRALNLSLGQTLVEQLETEKIYQTSAAHSADYREGVSAFVEKRTPKFSGK